MDVIQSESTLYKPFVPNDLFYIIWNYWVQMVPANGSGNIRNTNVNV